MKCPVRYRGVAHVGLPKTGSTYLQRRYFAEVSPRFFSTEVSFSWPHALAFVYDGNSLWYDDLVTAKTFLTRQDRENWYAVEVGTRMGRWQKAIHEFTETPEGQDKWISSAEGLCGLSADVNALHMSLLKQAGVRRVIFVCRQQAKWVMSLWRQFLLAEDRFARFVSFETLFGTPEADGVVDIDWTRYTMAMDAEFGADNVLVLPYEVLFNDPRAFFMRLNVFLGLAEDALIPNPGARENPSRTDSVYHGLTLDGVFPFDRLPKVRSGLHRLARKFPRLVPSFIKRVHSISVDAETLDALQSRMSSANQRLETRIGIDLKQYGYY